MGKKKSKHSPENDIILLESYAEKYPFSLPELLDYYRRNDCKIDIITRMVERKLLENS